MFTIGTITIIGIELSLLNLGIPRKLCFDFFKMLLTVLLKSKVIYKLSCFIGNY